jgi:hypothetical protein
MRLKSTRLFARPRLRVSWNNIQTNGLEIVTLSWDSTRKFPGEACLSRKEHQMDDERKSSKAGERAAEGLRQATAKEEAKNESKTGHDLAKGADRFEERSPTEKAQKKNRKDDVYRIAASN